MQITLTSAQYTEPHASSQSVVVDLTGAWSLARGPTRFGVECSPPQASIAVVYHSLIDTSVTKTLR